MREQLAHLDAPTLGIVANGLKLGRRGGRRYGYGYYGDYYGSAADRPPRKAGRRGPRRLPVSLHRQGRRTPSARRARLLKLSV